MKKQADIRTHLLSVLVDNEPGVLARVIGLFTGRGYNIDSLSVAEIDHENSTSRMSIVTSSTPQVLEQIKAQLSRLVPVHHVHDYTSAGSAFVRELALIRVKLTKENAPKIHELIGQTHAAILEEAPDALLVQVTDGVDEISALIDALTAVSDVEASRSGPIAI